MTSSNFFKELDCRLSSKPLKQPHVQWGALRRIQEWMEEPENRQKYVRNGQVCLPVDKKAFKADFSVANPTPSGWLNGADDTVINLMYRLLDLEVK